MAAEIQDEAWALAAQVAYWRTLQPWEKAAIMTGLCRAVQDLEFAGLRLRHPEASAEELKLRSACHRVGRELVEQVLGRPLPFRD